VTAPVSQLSGGRFHPRESGVTLRLIGFAIDAVVVLVFVGIGRRTHAEPNSVLSLLGAAWPFLVGLAIGWLIALSLVSASTKIAPLKFWGAVVVWGVTVLVGMLIRRWVGDGTAAAFVVVALATLAVLMLGWRLVGQQLLSARRRRRTASASARPQG